MTTKDGQIIGFEADLAKIFAAGMEVKLTLKSMHFDELLLRWSRKGGHGALEHDHDPAANLRLPLPAPIRVGQINPHKEGEYRQIRQHCGHERSGQDTGGAEGVDQSALR